MDCRHEQPRYKTEEKLRVLCTDISKDGALTGPNIELYQQIMAQFPTLTLIASGGVSELADLINLKRSGAAAVVIGKALLENRFTLDAAIKEVA